MNISAETRRKVIDLMLLREDPPYWGRLDLVSFLERVWDLRSMPSTDSRYPTADQDIFKHMVMNSDWTHQYLLNNYLSLAACGDEVFLNFVKESLDPVVITDEDVQSELADQLNEILAKEGYRLEPVKRVVGRKTYSSYIVTKVSAATADARKETAYEVVLSFAGEERAYVRQVAEYLKKHGISVFYDEYEEVALWGTDLAEHLSKVYQGATRYCVMFISNAYVEKAWTNVERRAALTRAIHSRSEYILPARFEGVEVPGLPTTISYVNIGERQPDELAEMILRKVRG